MGKLRWCRWVNVVVGEPLGEVGGKVVGVLQGRLLVRGHEPDDVHAGGAPGFHTGGGVLEDDTPPWLPAAPGVPPCH